VIKVKTKFQIITFLLFLISLASCNFNNGVNSSSVLSDYICRDTPFIESCFTKISGPSISEETTTNQITFNETFKEDLVGGQPFSWLLFRDDIYKVDTVEAKVLDNTLVDFSIPTDNRVLSLYSKGNIEPLYYPKSTLIFTREFNLDTLGYGVAEATILIPTLEANEIDFELVTGSANVIGLELNFDSNGGVNVVAGDVYYFYQGTTVVQPTSLKLDKNTWYTFRLEWNASADTVNAFMYDNNTSSLIPLYTGNFHQSVRFNAKKTGEPIPPNHVRFSMPFSVTKSGYAYVDNVKVEEQIDSTLFVNPNTLGGN
jgi:hypothetical protein